MSKHALIAAIATQSGESQAAVSRVLDALAQETKARLDASEELVIPGIGKLKPNVRPARTGRNPSNGEVIEIGAKVLVRFAAAKSLKDALN